MFLILFMTLLAFSAAVALIDWRRGWVLAVVCGVLQDPVRKMTAGTPVVLTFSIVAVYGFVLLGAQQTLIRMYNDFSRRFGRLYNAGTIFFLFLVLAAITGLITYGVALWKVPALSLFIYSAPLPAILVGYAYISDEETLTRFFRFYAVLTSIALIGNVLEYYNFAHASLGLVGRPGLYIRHLPGIQIRMLSGFYRAPDIMGWHAAMLTAISTYLAMRGRLKLRSWVWFAPAAWGFLHCVISGRRKAVYMVAVFAGVFVWRYFRRLTTAQVVVLAFVGVAFAGVLYNLAANERSRTYTEGAVASRGEVFERLEGGVIETIRQFGIMGAGLGTATQGVQHLLGPTQNVGWQEGGLGKLAIELGLPGLLAAMFLAFVLMRMLLIISGAPDEPGSSQLLRAALFAMVVANIVNFLASAQAYSDAVLTLMTAFILGALLGTARLGDAAAPAAATEPETPLQPARITAPA